MNFVFDLDGTICYKGKPVTDFIGNALAKLTSEGHQVLFASARPIRDMLPVLNQRFHTYSLIGGNGSLIHQNGESVHVTSFTNKQMVAIKSLLNEFEAQYLIDGVWDYSYTGPEDHPILHFLDPATLAKKVELDTHESVVKVLILAANSMEALGKRLAVLDVVVHKHGNENVLDISPPDIHKWEALRTLQIEKGNYVAFGNDANDVTLFRNAAHSVMIGYHEELAKYATESIPLDDHVEDRIVAKLDQLSRMASLS